MAAGPERIVIVGAGLAGATAALALREEGFTGSIELIGQERHPPYNRPPLSKEYLRGEARFDDQHVRPARDYADRGIRLTLGAPATGLDAVARAVTRSDGSRVAYDRCRASLPDVFAAGDVANHLHPLFGRLRVEHWNNADQQGRPARGPR